MNSLDMSLEYRRSRFNEPGIFNYIANLINASLLVRCKLHPLICVWVWLEHTTCDRMRERCMRCENTAIELASEV